MITFAITLFLIWIYVDGLFARHYKNLACKALQENRQYTKEEVEKIAIENMRNGWYLWFWYRKIKKWQNKKLHKLEMKIK